MIESELPVGILKDKDSMRLYWARWMTDDPLKDWYDEEEIADALMFLILKELGG